LNFLKKLIEDFSYTKTEDLNFLENYEKIKNNYKLLQIRLGVFKKNIDSNNITQNLNF
jgi:hypothetical protein